MKAYHNYTTAMTTAIRLRWGTAILLTLAALIVGLMLLLSSNKQSTTSTSTSASSVRHVSEALVSCRACRDEWVTAQAPIIPSGGVDFDQPRENFRTSGPR